MYVKRPYRERWQSGEVPKKSAPPEEVRNMGERFRQARKALGLYQPELAAGAKVSQDGISRFESGDRGLRLDQFVRLIQYAATRGVDVGFVVLGPRTTSPAIQPDVSPAAKAASRSRAARAARTEIPVAGSGDEDVDETTGRVRKSKRAAAR